MTEHKTLSLFSLQNKVAIVTGGSRGIGWAIVEAYASAGANVIFFYNSSSDQEIRTKIDYIEKTYGVRCRAFKVNLLDPKSIQASVDTILEEFEKIDIFVANAGVTWNDKDILYIKDDDEAYQKWRRIFDVDVDAVHLCARSIGRVFKKQGHGNLILTTSISAHIVNIPQYQTPYNTAKAALVMYGKCLAVEWVKFARVNMISPGYIATDMVHNLPQELVGDWLKLIPKGKMAKPEDLVGAYVYLASDASSFCVGTDIIIDGGYTLV